MNSPLRISGIQLQLCKKYGLLKMPTVQEVRWWAIESQRLTSVTCRSERAGFEAAKIIFQDCHESSYVEAAAYMHSARRLLDAYRESGLAP